MWRGYAVPPLAALAGFTVFAALAVFSRGYFVSIQSRIGDATYTELNVPVMMPNAMTHANGRITSPAKKSSASVAASAVACVRTERGSVSFTERLSVL